METERLERTDEDHTSGETPEDVAILYSWANLQGAKYRDFSANRREYRAQMRHRAAEQLRLMELRAQSEAEAAAAQAESEAAAAHAEADAATVKLAASRAMPAVAPEAILEERAVEQIRRSSLREAAQQARRAAAERLEAARRAEAAALADSIARREEREIAEAQASALRQAAQYHDSEMRSKQTMAQQPPEDQVPGHLNDPYSPQVLAEGAYYDGPGMPPSELESSRFRSQREYIEKATGTELPPFKMPPLFVEDRQAERPRHPGPDAGVREFPDDGFAARRVEPMPRNLPLRRPVEVVREDREHNQERYREGRNAALPYRWEAAARPQSPPSVPERDMYPAQPIYDQAYEPMGDHAPGRSAMDVRSAEMHPRPASVRPGHADGQRRGHQEEESDRGLGAYDGSLLMGGGDRAGEARRRVPGGAPFERDRRQDPADGEEPFTAAIPRPTGSWLRRISGEKQSEPRPERLPELRPELRREPRTEPAASFLPEKRHPEVETEDNERAVFRAGQSPRPSVEATYADGLTSAGLTQVERQPSGFRPPWLTQAQAPRPSGPRSAAPAPEVVEKPVPRWLYTEPIASEPVAEPVAQAAAQQAAAAPLTAIPAEGRAEAVHRMRPTSEAVASRWFALKGVFEQGNVTGVAERQQPKEAGRTTPVVAVFSLAGGVGKTSLVATLGRALSSPGEKVLLADTTSHGLLPLYFGAKELHPGVARTFSPPHGSADAPVSMVSYELGAQAANGEAQRKMVDDLLTNGKQANRVLIDLNASCAWVVERLAGWKPLVVVPLAADMNSIISLPAVEKAFSAMRDSDGEPLRPIYLLNQFDASMPLHLDVREVLRKQLGDRLIPLVVRRAAAVSEALAEGMTIFDYDPDSPAAHDIVGLANWIRAVSAPAAAAGFRNLRWSER